MIVDGQTGFIKGLNLSPICMKEEQVWSIIHGGQDQRFIDLFLNFCVYSIVR